jgi:hypothetical protein
MSSVTRRIKRNIHELETGRRNTKRQASYSKRIDQRITRAEARLKGERT